MRGRSIPKRSDDARPPSASDNLGTEQPPTAILPGFDLWAQADQAGDDVTLTWADQGAGAYQVWRSTDPYFAPGDPGAELLETVAGLSTTDTGVTCAGCPNRYYVVAADETTSTTVGVHTLDVWPGFNMVPLSLVNPNLPNASSLVSVAGAGFALAIYFWHPGQSWISWWIGSPYGEWTNRLGDTPLVNLSIPGAETRALTGYVPSPGELSLPLVQGTNFMTLPLTHPDMMASEVIASAEPGLVIAIGGWNAETQTPRWYPADGDFLVESGSNLAVEVTAPAQWPFPAPSSCGDGIVDEGEECDDGNLDDYDGCESTCVRTIAEAVMTNGTTCIRTVYGDVKCWGVGGYLGTGTTENIGDDESPAAIGFIDLGAPAVDIATGSSSVCAALQTGGIRCFGSNGIGRLGLGIGNVIVGDDEPPTAYPEIDFGDLGGASFVGVASVRAGGACGILDTGGVRCWGDPRTVGYNVDDPTGPFEPFVTAIGDDETPAEAGYGDVPVGLPVTRLWATDLGYLARTSTGSIRAWGTFDPIFAFDPPTSIGFREDDPTPADIGDLPFGGDRDGQPLGRIWGRVLGAERRHAVLLGIRRRARCPRGCPGTTRWVATTASRTSPKPGRSMSAARLRWRRATAGARVPRGSTASCGVGAPGGRASTAGGHTNSVGNDESPSAGVATDVGGTVALFANAVYATHWCVVLETGALKCWGTEQRGPARPRAHRRHRG